MTAIVTILIALFVLPLLGFLFGSFSGWVVGLFFADTVLTFFSQMGIDGMTMWQIGGALGFIGGFFKSGSAAK